MSRPRSSPGTEGRVERQPGLAGQVGRCRRRGDTVRRASGRAPRRLAAQLGGRVTARDADRGGCGRRAGSTQLTRVCAGGALLHAVARGAGAADGAADGAQRAVPGARAHAPLLDAGATLGAPGAPGGARPAGPPHARPRGGAARPGAAAGARAAVRRLGRAAEPAARGAPRRHARQVL